MALDRLPEFFNEIFKQNTGQSLKLLKYKKSEYCKDFPSIWPCDLVFDHT